MGIPFDSATLLLKVNPMEIKAVVGTDMKNNFCLYHLLL